MLSAMAEMISVELGQTHALPWLEPELRPVKAKYHLNPYFSGVFFQCRLIPTLTFFLLRWVLFTYSVP